jgi:hypothetical protein
MVCEPRELVETVKQVYYEAAGPSSTGSIVFSCQLNLLKFNRSFALLAKS